MKEYVNLLPTAPTHRIHDVDSLTPSKAPALTMCTKQTNGEAKRGPTDAEDLQFQPDADAPREISLTFVALMGSERVHGNTAQVLSSVSRFLAARQVRLQVLKLTTLKLAACGPCGDCNRRTAPCALDDDMPSVIDAMRRADGIIYAAPVHAFGMSQTMQSFLERAGVGFLRFERPLANKVAGVIVTGRRYSHMQVYSQLQQNILLNRMVLTGSGYPAIVAGGSPGTALHDDEGMASVRAMVSRMVSMASLLKRASRSGFDLPVDTHNERTPMPSTPAHSPTYVSP
jgi:multimeric flavodoxin WrbA